MVNHQLMLIGLALALSGCSVPYVANISSPIRAIRVLDAETGQDVPGAWVDYRTDRVSGPIERITMCELTAREPSSHKPDYVSIEIPILGSDTLSRSADRSFAMPLKLEVGYYKPVQIRDSFHDFSEYPRARIEARSLDHYWATVSYTTKSRLRRGWRAASPICDAHLEPDGYVKHFASGGNEAARCELDQDGVLRFYLHRLPASQEPLLLGE